MVICCRLRCLEEEQPKVFRFKDNQAGAKGEQPAQIPIPLRAFDSESDVPLVTLFAKDLERRLLPDSLGRDRIRLDSSRDRNHWLVPAPEEFNQRKTLMGSEPLRQRRHNLDSISPEIAVILPGPAPGDEVPTVSVIGEPERLDISA